MRIALLGAGHFGTTIARLLAGCGDYRVSVFDRDPARLAPLAVEGIATRVSTLEAAPALADALAGQDAVINALPFDRAIDVARVAAAAGVHYFDLTEDVAATRTIRELAQGAQGALMPQCGLAPGFIGIAAHHLAQGFDTLLDLKLRVGALPVYPTNALKYNLTWSVEGLINEYCHPCEAIQDGAPTELQPLEGLDRFALDGVDYEAFNTSGGLGTLCETLDGRVRTLDYKSVRYPGHRELMRTLLDDLRLRDDPSTLKAILRRAVPATMQDVVLVFVSASGLRAGALVQEVFVRKVFARPAAGEGETPLSAIQITTAAGACAAVDLFRAGRLPQRGFIRQEQIALPEFLANRFGSACGELDR
jgi:saccharopine dehydrogenase-like NADP-dependent oxidoreductase